MNTPIKNPKKFITHLCKACGLEQYDQADRACVITRSPANYGEQGSVIIEWEGSPPRFPIIFARGQLLVDGNRIIGPIQDAAESLVERFLKAHPANTDNSPVWIGPRFEERRQRKGVRK